MCSAIARRIALSFTTSSRAPSTRTAGRAAGAGAGCGAAGAAAGATVEAVSPTTASTSSRVTRPPMPVPRRLAASMPCSAASFRTAGDRRARSLLPSAPAEAGGGGGGGCGCGISRGRGTRDFDLCDDGANADGLAFGRGDLDELALEGRGDLCVDLVGHDLDQGLVALDEVTLALEPFLDRALGHRLAELGHLDLGQAHAGSSWMNVWSLRVYQVPQRTRPMP